MWTVLVLGVAGSLAVFQYARSAQRRGDEAEFQRRVTNYLAAFQERRNGIEDLLRTLRALFQQKPGLSRSQFHEVIRDLSIRLDGIQALVWTPRIQHSQRLEFEQRIRGEGFDGFRFTEGDVIHAPSELPTLAADREEYFPVVFLEPYEGNEHVLGYDLSATEIDSTLKRVRDSGGVGLSSQVRLPYGGGIRRGFVVAIPVYSSELLPETPEARREQLSGYVIAVLVSDIIMEALDRRAADPALDVLLLDLSAGTHDRVIAANVDSPSSEWGALELEYRRGAHFEKDLSLGGKEWAILFRRGASWATADRWYPVSLLGSGLLLTGFLVHTFRASVRRTRQVEELVEYRTAELAKANTRLKDEIKVRMKAEMQLAHDRGLLRTLIDHLPDGVFVTDAEGRYLTLNAAHLRLLELSEESQVVGLPLSQAGSSAVAGCLNRRAAAARDSGAPVLEKEDSVTLAEGRSINLLISLVPLRDESGLSSGLVGLCRDVTEEKRAASERSAFQQRWQESQKLESLGLLAGGIAHDFNNLLTSILGYAGLAAEEIPAGAPVRDYLANVESSAMRAADLCKQMLAYSGKGRFVINHLDLSSVVRETTELLRSSITKKAALELDLASELPAVLGDATQLQQILMSLVVNASDALGEDGGTIRVSTGCTRVDTAFLRRTVLATEVPEGDYVYLQVSDDGCGMTPEVQARIFDPFYTTKFTGRGLGLAAVLGIVRGHRGALSVVSEPSKGTTFTLVLPQEDKKPEQKRPQTRVADKFDGHGTILVVDDEEPVRQVAAVMLKRTGFKVELACDGREALERFQANPRLYRAVLLDLTMPRMDGVEAFRALRRVDPGVKVLLMSGYSPEEADHRFAGQGLDGFIAKPFTAPRLLGALQDLLQSKQN